MKPFLKWPGSKRWLAPILSDILAGFQYERWIEPFLGSGSLFFHFKPKAAILSDINWELINTYRMVAKHPSKLSALLRAKRTTATAYYLERGKTPTSGIARAARLLYLNRTCFRGIYRVNQCGEFNVPYGGGDRDASVFFKTAILREASLVLKSAKLAALDFEEALGKAGAGDLVYCDPIYHAAETDCFARYNEKLFSWGDQLRLAKACYAAERRGANVILSNAECGEIRRLYPKALILPVARQNSLGVDRRKNGFKETITFLGNDLRHQAKKSSAVFENEKDFRCIA